ncbi:type III-B CRISPR-associated protein Cas10/Cmr2 [Limnothrix sp. FACHB-881]|nr:type III-B CRISPR-associated protein Cas10/Cmr2 [Limnothrix sp. FACHB-881]
MSRIYWQAKIWGLLHDPALKTLRPVQNLSDEGPWHVLKCMDDWYSPKVSDSQRKQHPERYDSSKNTLQGNWLKHVAKCDLIASASDRTSMGRLPYEISVSYKANDGLEITHLMSGAPQTLRFDPSFKVDDIRQSEIDCIPATIRDCLDHRKVFWWLWRCYPAALARKLGEQVQLLPADTRIPDASLWSHVSTTSALAGALAGRYPNDADYPQYKKQSQRPESRPHVLSFTFTPIQEFVVASRKLRDLWAGSWTLHYLSAKACWDLAWNYGPDVLLYPCLYEQPLIDYWLLQTYPDFKDWIEQPSDRALLTAGFPNVIVAILPDNGQRHADGQPQAHSPIEAAAQSLQQSVRERWSDIAAESLAILQGRDGRSTGQTWKAIDQSLWNTWIKAQWQPYWVALPIGDPNEDLDRRPVTKNDQDGATFRNWCQQQNQLAQAGLLEPAEAKFVEVMFGLMPDLEDSEDETETTLPRATDEQRSKKAYKQPNVNVGSWWGNLFDATRSTLTAVKNARVWQIPTAFGPRSTISGIGPAVRSPLNSHNPNWATEDDTRAFWEKTLGLFNGSEQLNPSETTKRVLPRLLPKFFPQAKELRNRSAIYQPDLTAGLAGWLKTTAERSPEKFDETLLHYQAACQAIITEFDWTQEAADTDWGIPWVDRDPEKDTWPNPRLVNAGWLVDDFSADNSVLRANKRREIATEITKFFPSNNPTDWYVLAQGDGDSMNQWLKGTKLTKYRDYLPKVLLDKLKTYKDPVIKTSFESFTHECKRMGPATHSALSRSLLDFSNRLVPYLTEDRYAGRLIYSGGDDVLAYSNLWEWDRWLWDVRQCFRGDEDPQGEFSNAGHYWSWQGASHPRNLPKRPLFTLGKKASISFGVVIANQGVPLAIALEQLRAAEKAAKDHAYPNPDPNAKPRQFVKDAVQVRVIYGNGNILQATAKFDTFSQWQALLNFADQHPNLDAALFEQAAEIWDQHPPPIDEAITPWVEGFLSRRDAFAQNDESRDQFSQTLQSFLKALDKTTASELVNREVQAWLKLAAFLIRKRQIR